MKSRITVADLVMGVGGVVTFLSSFFAFFKLGRGRTVNAWDGDAGAFATTVPALLGAFMVVWIGLEIAGVAVPERVLTYNRAQVKGTWGISAAGIMLSWVSADFGGTDKGLGFWFMFFGSFAMLAGAIMGLLGAGTRTIDIPGANSGSKRETSPLPPPAPGTEPGTGD